MCEMSDNAKNNISYDDMLIDAAINNDSDKLQVALRAGADVNAKDYAVGISALSHAIHRGHNEIVLELCKNKADCNVCEDKSARSPLICAINVNNQEAFEILISHGANVDLVTEKGPAAMHMAVLNKQYNTISRLVELRANIDVMDNSHGLTPLTFAVHKNDRKAIKMLIDYGADYKAKDFAGHDLFLFAKQHDNDEAGGELAEYVNDCVTDKNRFDLKYRGVKKRQQLRRFMNGKKPF